MSLEKKLRTLSRLLKRYLYVQTHTRRHPHTHTHTHGYSHNRAFPFLCHFHFDADVGLVCCCSSLSARLKVILNGDNRPDILLVYRTSGQRDIGSNGTTGHCDAFEFYQRHVEIFKLSTFVLELGKPNPIQTPPDPPPA